MLGASTLLVLVLAAGTLSALSVVLLVAMAVIDYRREELW